MKNKLFIISLIFFVHLTFQVAFAQDKVTKWNIWSGSSGQSRNINKQSATFAESMPLPDNPDIQLFPSSNPQTENSIAINPANPMNLLILTNGRLIVSNNIITNAHQTHFFSMDGGKSWQGSEDNPNGISTWGDPVALFNTYGNAYYVALGNPSGITVLRSTDGGSAWGSAVNADSLNSYGDDKEHAMADLSGTYAKNLYVAWTDFDAIKIPVVLTRSTDEGFSFGSRKTLYSGPDLGHGANIAVGPNGEVYVAFANYTNGNLPETGIRFTKSSDGGQSFLSADVAFNISGIRLSNNGQSEFNNIRVNSFPSMDVDRSNGIHRGRIYIVYADRNTGDSDIYLRYSSDKGNTWSDMIKVNDDQIGNGQQQWSPSVSVDSDDGTIYVSYYNMDTTGVLTARYVAGSTNGGNTFSTFRVSDVRFTPSELGYPFADGYMGDYYEITAFNKNVYSTWSDDRTGTFQAFVSKFEGIKDVTVDQIVSGVTTDSIDRWEGSNFVNYKTPNTFSFLINDNEVLRGSQKIIMENKYNKWNIDDTISNHRKFKITQSFSNRLVSNFEPTKNNITMRNEFISAPGSNPQNDVIYFKDPWLRDYNESPYGKRNQGMNAPFKQRQSPFSPDTNTSYSGDVYQGVFLGQGYADPSKPYYSVKVDAQQTFTAHGQDITGYFLNWDGTDVQYQNPNAASTPLVFNAANAEARAVYKGHLASNVARTTGYNNGRCIAKDFSGKLHLVYEDDGKIWHTTSTSNGYAWDKDEQIPPAQYTGLSSVPSIAITSEPAESNIHVVWEAEVAKSNSQIIHVICYSRKSSSGWSTPIILSEGSFSSFGFWTGPDCHRPVIVGGGSGYVNVAWKAGNNIKIRNLSNGSWSNPAIIPGAYDGYPVIGRTYSGTLKTKIIWSDDGDIRYIEGDYMGNNSWNWSTSKSLTSSYNSAIYFNYCPTMDIASDGKGYVSWEAVSVSSGQRGVYFCKYDMYNNAAQAWFLTKIDEKYSEHFYPSINWDEQSNRSTLTYQKTNHIYNLINNYNSSTWSKSDYGAGHYPNLPTADSPVTVWTTYNSSPYLLKNYIMNSYLTKNAIAEVSEYKRFIYLTGQDSVYLTADLQRFSINGKAFTFGQDLKSSTVNINGEASFDYQIVLDSIQTETSRELMSFWFVSGNKKYFLDRVAKNGHDKKIGLEHNVRFKPGKTLEGFVEIKFEKEKPFIMNIVPTGKEMFLTKQYAFTNQGSNIPKYFTLEQNYPNPFNPVTHIRFALPESGEVTLTVYDMTGRVVSTLVNGYKSAGRYDVTFDGSVLASGEYIYRLEAGRIFVETKKLLLVK